MHLYTTKITTTITYTYKASLNDIMMSKRCSNNRQNEKYKRKINDNYFGTFLLLVQII